MPADTPAPRRVVLHVGVPKSGTTFLQRGLWLNREPLQRAGFRCPGSNQQEMFHAAVEVRGSHRAWGFRPEELEGTWRRLCAEARVHEGTTVMSHEILAAATREQAAAALTALEDVDLHLVVTARDLARQLVSEWQERVKNGSTSTFEEFRTTVEKRIPERDFTGHFWRSQDIPGILDRWGGHLPAEKVHVVVAPRAGADPEELWRQFGAAAGFSVEGLPPTPAGGTANPSLGVTQIAILRQVNEALADRIVQPAYARVVKRYFGQSVLPRHPSPRPSCPPDLVTPLRDLSAEWIREIERRGYAVHGDLADLLPQEPDEAAASPDDVDPRDQADISAAVIADLLVEVRDLRARVRRLSGPGARAGGDARSSVLRRLSGRARTVLRPRSRRPPLR